MATYVESYRSPTGQITPPDVLAGKQQMQRDKGEQITSDYPISPDEINRFYAYNKLSRDLDQLKEYSNLVGESDPKTYKAYKEAIDKGMSEKDAIEIAIKSRAGLAKSFQNMIYLTEARMRDKRRTGVYGQLQNIFWTAENARQRFRQAITMITEGENDAIAQRYASDLMAYHDPTSPLDQLMTEMVSQSWNALSVAVGALAPSTILPKLAAMTGIAAFGSATAANLAGYSIAAGLSATPVYTDTYLDLRGRDVPEKDAMLAAGLNALLVTGVELGMMPGLAAVGGRLWKAGGLPTHKIEALRRLTGIMVADKTSGVVGATEKAVKDKMLTELQAHLLRKEMYGPGSKGKILLDIAKTGSVSAFSGGAEEWVQDALDMFFKDYALAKNKLPGELPRNEDGSVDTAAMIKRMNKAFAMGAIMEGLMGTAGGMANIAGSNSFKMADNIQAIKDYIGGFHSQIIVDKDKTPIAFWTREEGKPIFYDLYYEPGAKPIEIPEGSDSVNIGAFNSEIKDFIVRKMLSEIILKTEDVVKTKGEKALTQKALEIIHRDALKNAVQTIISDPDLARTLQFPNLKLAAHGKNAVSLDINGKTHTIVRATEKLPQNANAWTIYNAPDRATIGVSEEVWQDLVSRGLTDRIITVNMYKGTTLGHEIFHAVLKAMEPKEYFALLDTIPEVDARAYAVGHLPESKQARAAKKLRPEEIEHAKQEMLAERFEGYQTTAQNRPISTVFGDSKAAMEVFLWGRNASPEAKQRVAMKAARGVTQGYDFSMQMLTSDGFWSGAALPILQNTGKAAGKVAVATARTAQRMGKGSIPYISTGLSKTGEGLQRLGNRILTPKEKSPGAATPPIKKQTKQGMPAKPIRAKTEGHPQLKVTSVSPDGKVSIQMTGTVKPEVANAFRNGSITLQKALEKSGFSRLEIQAITALAPEGEKDLNKIVNNAQEKMFGGIVIQPKFDYLLSEGDDYDGDERIFRKRFSRDYESYSVKRDKGRYKEFYITCPWKIPGQHGEMAHPNLLGWLRVREYKGQTFEVQELQSELFQHNFLLYSTQEESQSDGIETYYTETQAEREDVTGIRDQDYSWMGGLLSLPKEGQYALRLLADNNTWVPAFMSMAVEYARANDFKEVRFPTGKTVFKVERYDAFSSSDVDAHEHLINLQDRLRNSKDQLMYEQDKLRREGYGLELPNPGDHAITYSEGRNIHTVYYKDHPDFQKLVPLAEDEAHPDDRLQKSDYIHKLTNNLEDTKYFYTDEFDLARIDEPFTSKDPASRKYLQSLLPWQDYATALWNVFYYEQEINHWENKKNRERIIPGLHAEIPSSAASVVKFYEHTVRNIARRYGAVKIKDDSGYYWNAIPLEGQWQDTGQYAEGYAQLKTTIPFARVHSAEEAYVLDKKADKIIRSVFNLSPSEPILYHGTVYEFTKFDSRYAGQHGVNFLDPISLKGQSNGTTSSYEEAMLYAFGDRWWDTEPTGNERPEQGSRIKIIVRGNIVGEVIADFSGNGNVYSFIENPATAENSFAQLKTTISPQAMTYPMPAADNVTGKATSTLELAEKGLRISATRSYPLGKVGDVFQMLDATNKVRPQMYRITKIHQITAENMKNPAFIKRLSETEGWTEEAIRTKFPNQIKAGAWVTVYERIQAPKPLVAQGGVPAKSATSSTGRKVAIIKQNYTPELLRSHPNAIFLFGDNLQKKGKAGQAVIRDEPNAIGIPTKKAPSMTKGSFFTDTEYNSNIAAIDAALARIPANANIVIPAAGLGTGMAQLDKRAPKTFAYLQNKIKALIQSGQLVQPQGVPLKPTSQSGQIQSPVGNEADTGAAISTNKSGLQVQARNNNKTDEVASISANKSGLQIQAPASNKTDEDNVTSVSANQSGLQVQAQGIPATAPKTINIWHGKNQNAILSNLAYRPFTYQGMNFQSVEHAYQSLKSGTLDLKTYEAYPIGKAVEGVKIQGLPAKTADGYNVKLMQNLMRASFSQNPSAAAALKATGNAILTHTQDKGIWSTEFPRILMDIRGGNTQALSMEIGPQSKFSPYFTKNSKIRGSGPVLKQPFVGPHRPGPTWAEIDAARLDFTDIDNAAENYVPAEQSAVPYKRKYKKQTIKGQPGIGVTSDLPSSLPPVSKGRQVRYSKKQSMLRRNVPAQIKALEEKFNIAQAAFEEAERTYLASLPAGIREQKKAELDKLVGDYTTRVTKWIDTNDPALKPVIAAIVNAYSAFKKLMAHPTVEAQARRELAMQRLDAAYNTFDKSQEPLTKEEADRIGKELSGHYEWLTKLSKLEKKDFKYVEKITKLLESQGFTRLLDILYAHTDVQAVENYAAVQKAEQISKRLPLQTSEDRAFAEEMIDSQLSINVDSSVVKGLKTKTPGIGNAARATQKQELRINARLPMTKTAMDALMMDFGIDINSPAYKDRYVYDRDGTLTGIKGTFDFLENIQSWDSREKISTITEATTPAWIIANELAYFKQQLKEGFPTTPLETRVLKDIFRLIDPDTRLKLWVPDAKELSMNGKLILQAALFTYMTQSGKWALIGRPGIPYKVKVTFRDAIVPKNKNQIGQNSTRMIDIMDVAYWLSDRFGFELAKDADGNPIQVSIDELGSSDYLPQSEQSKPDELGDEPTAIDSGDENTAEDNSDLVEPDDADNLETEAEQDEAIQLKNAISVDLTSQTGQTFEVKNTAQFIALEIYKQLGDIIAIQGLDQREIENIFGRSRTGNMGGIASQGSSAVKAFNFQANDNTKELQVWKYDNLQNLISGVIQNSINRRKDPEYKGIPATDKDAQTALDILKDALTVKNAVSTRKLTAASFLADTLAKELGEKRDDIIYSVIETLNLAEKAVSENVKVGEDEFVPAIQNLLSEESKNTGFIRKLAERLRGFAQLKSVEANNYQAVRDCLHGERDLNLLDHQQKMMVLLDKWRALFDLPPEDNLRTIVKGFVNSLLGKTLPNGLTDLQNREEARNWSLPAVFALDYWYTTRNMKTKPTAEEWVKANTEKLQARIDRINSKPELSTQDRYAITELSKYIVALSNVDSIVNRKDFFGPKIHDFLHNVYIPATKEAWNTYRAASLMPDKAHSIDFWTPWLFEKDDYDPESFDQHSFNQFTARILGRIKESVFDHLADEELLSNPDLLGAYNVGVTQVINAVANRDFIDAQLALGYFTEEAQKGYKPLQSPGTRKLHYIVTKNGNKIGDFTSWKEAVQSAKKNRARIDKVYNVVYAPDIEADYVNRITRSSPIRNNPVGRALMATNAKLKLIRVMWSMFHRRSLLWSAMLAGPVTEGMNFQLSDLSDWKVLWAKIKSRFNYIDRRALGQRMMMEQSHLLYAGAYYGLTIPTAQDFGAQNLSYLTQLDKWILSDSESRVKNISRNTLIGFSRATRALQNELFGKFGAFMKTAVYVMEVNKLTQKHAAEILAQKEASEKTGNVSEVFAAMQRTNPEAAAKMMEQYGGLGQYYSETEETIHRAVAGHVNADFGGQHIKRMGISAGTFDIFRLLLLGPDWTASNFLTLSKLWKRGSNTAYKQGADAFTSASDIERDLYTAFWFRALSRAAVIVFIGNLLMSGLDDETAFKRLSKAWNRGKLQWAMIDVSPFLHLLGGDPKTDHYLDFAGIFLEPGKWVEDPLKAYYHRSSVVIKPAIELFTGLDYKGQRPNTAGEILSKGLYDWQPKEKGNVRPAEMPAFLTMQAYNLLPIQMKNLLEVAEGERNAIALAFETVTGTPVKRTWDNQFIKGG